MTLNMTRKEKRQFITDLCRSIKKESLAKVPSMPENWDGLELRQYLADKFDDSRMNHCIGIQRLREYHNTMEIIP